MHLAGCCIKTYQFCLVKTSALLQPLRGLHGPVYFDTPPPELPISMTATMLKVSPQSPLLIPILLPSRKGVKSLDFHTFGANKTTTSGSFLSSAQFICSVPSIDKLESSRNRYSLWLKIPHPKDRSLLDKTPRHDPLIRMTAPMDIAQVDDVDMAPEKLRVLEEVSCSGLF